MTVGTEVIIPEPNDSDIHKYSFQGIIVEINEDELSAVVVDQDGNHFEMELNRLTEADDESV